MGARNRRTIWQLLAAFLPLGIGGCGSSSQSFADVQAGRIELAELERTALDQLLLQIGLSAELLDVDGDITAANSAWISDGHVRAITLTDQMLSDLSVLAPLTQLVRIRFNGGRLDSLRGLEPDCGVQVIYVSDAGLSDVDGILNCSALQDLSLNGNRLQSIPSLSALTRLRSLDLSRNQLQTIPPITGLAELEQINLASNRLRSCPQVTELGSLKRLVLSRNQLADLAALSHLPRLRELLVDDNQLIDASAVDHFDQLEVLNLNGNQLHAFPKFVGAMDPLLWSGNPGYQQQIATDFEQSRARLTEQGMVDGLPEPDKDADSWSSGGCRWNGNSPKCSLMIDELRGVRRKYIGRWSSDPITTDPRRRGISGVVVRLSVTHGQVRLYLARQASGIDAEGKLAAEARVGYPYIQASGGDPKAMAGQLFTDAVGIYVLLEAVAGPASGVRYEIEPGYVP